MARWHSRCTVPFSIHAHIKSSSQALSPRQTNNPTIFFLLTCIVTDMQSMWRSEMVSYPPPFRQTHLQEPASLDETLLNVHPNQKQPQQQTLGLDADLPFIDLLHPDPKVLGQACRDWGIFRLVNHGIPPQLTDRVRSYAKDLFALPFESKQSLFSTTSPIAYFWGSPNIQHSVLNLNRVEGFHALLPKLALQQQHQHQQQLQHDQPQQLMFESFRYVLFSLLYFVLILIFFSLFLSIQQGVFVVLPPADFLRSIGKIVFIIMVFA